MSRTIRPLADGEIATLLDWAADEGWNPGLHDARAFATVDPEGFIGAFVDGAMVAAIAAVAYDDRFGFIGLYICHPDWRGQGHGKAVWDAGLARLGPRTIGLDGVAEQQANYANMGFVPAYRTIRMSGTLAGRELGGKTTPVALKALAPLERLGFPARRDAFLRAWLAPPHRVLVQAQAEIIEAYGVLRPCRTGSKLGPLFARSPEAAAALLDQIAGEIHIDVPAFQTGWLKTLENRGLRAGFETQRMYRGTPAAIAQDTVFGVTSLELG